MIIFWRLLLLTPVMVFALLTDGTQITSLVVREKAGVTTANYPVTFGHRRWDEGSIKHAVISVVLPSVTANQDLTVSLVAGGTNAAGSGQMSATQILSTNFDAKIVCTKTTGEFCSTADSVSARPLVNGTLN